MTFHAPSRKDQSHTSPSGKQNFKISIQISLFSFIPANCHDHRSGTVNERNKTRVLHHRRVQEDWKTGEGGIDGQTSRHSRGPWLTVKAAAIVGRSLHAPLPPKRWSHLVINLICVIHEYAQQSIMTNIQQSHVSRLSDPAATTSMPTPHHRHRNHHHLPSPEPPLHASEPDESLHRHHQFQLHRHYLALPPNRILHPKLAQHPSPQP